jgi:hypothetical protein
MQGSYEYDMKISPADNMLYLSVPQKYQVWRVEALDPRDVGDPKLNKITVAGNGERCIPGDTTDQCGDNGLAVNARLNFPKGTYLIRRNMKYYMYFFKALQFLYYT